MNYWEGYMDWTLNPAWVCETCGEHTVLQWGLIHAQCRCEQCHTQYIMRDEDDKVVTTPICLLKPEYKIPAKKLWNKYHKPIDEATDNEWDFVMPTEPLQR